jgi:hypothetical protein
MGRLNRRGRRRVWPWLLLGAGVVVVLLAIDAAWAGSRAVAGFERARDGLERGGQQLLDGEPVGASTSFASADAGAATAVGALGHPGVEVASWLPWIGPNVDAARRAATAAELAAQGGAAYVNAAQAVGWDGTTLPGFSAGGRIDADVIAKAAPGMEQAASLLARADEELAPVDPQALFSRIRGPIGDAKEEIHARAQQAATAAHAAAILPPMLGATSPRTYLLITLSMSDPRGAGGYPGVFGLLHVNGERLTLSGLSETSKVPKAHPPVPGPAEAKRVWGWAGIDQALWDTTYTPDFPTAAGFMKRITQTAGLPAVDGVIAGDTAFMASMLGVVGPVDTPAWPEQLNAETVPRIVGADAYRTTSAAQSDAWQKAIGAAMWRAVLTRPWPLQPLATALADARDGGHLHVWSTQPEEEQGLDALGVSGAFRLPADGSPVVTFNGYTANRAGYFAKITQDVERSIDADGNTVVTETVTIHNTAPSGPPSMLLGHSGADTGGKPLGTFGTDVNVYMPLDAEVLSTEQNGKQQVPFQWRELGAKAVSLSPLIPPGETATVTVEYRLAARG